VVETTRVPRDRILRLGAAEAIVLRDRTVPLIRLTEVLGLSASETGTDADARVVVVNVSGPNVAGHDTADSTGAKGASAPEIDAIEIDALEVDALGERVDVMLKPMEGLLAGVRGFAGTTLLGDGRVLIVLDIPELLR
jgi:two-component system chemotaxis sensor kinase CheA